MSEVENPPADWVLLEALKKTNWSEHPTFIRAMYRNTNPSFRALCDMIARHEQPPADPDVEAVNRILLAFYGSPVILGEDAIARAVAQYKQERAK